MAKKRYGYHVEYPGKERNLTAREIIFLRKLCRVSGKRLIYEIANNPAHKYRKYFLDVWHDVKHGNPRSGFNSTRCLEAMCEVEPGAYDTWYLPQGMLQSRTYRSNRFEESINYATNTMAAGEWKDLSLVWRLDTDINADRVGYDARIRDMSSYVIANSRAEAESVWQTMVLLPLGIKERERLSCRPRFLGPTQNLNVLELNMEALSDTKKRIEKKTVAYEKILKELKSTQERSEFAFALINQTLAMVGSDDGSDT